MAKYNILEDIYSASSSYSDDEFETDDNIEPFDSFVYDYDDMIEEFNKLVESVQCS